MSEIKNYEHEYMIGWMSMYSQPQELTAIWLENPVITGSGKRFRIAPGELISVEKGQIVDVKLNPTHKVLRCTGTLYGNFEIAVVELFTNELSQIKLSKSCIQIN